MKLSKSPPEEIVADLRRLAETAAIDLFPDVPKETTLEWEAAEFIELAAAFLQQLVDDDGPLADQARSILGRCE